MRVARLRWLKVRIFSSEGTAPAADRPAPRSTSETTGGPGRRSFGSINRGGGIVRGTVVTLLASVVATTSLVGVLATAASAATTTPVSMDLSSGTFGPQGNTPRALPATTTPGLTGTENETTGAISTATLTIPPQPEKNTGTSETISIYEATPKSAKATINTQGNVTVADTLYYEVHITSPLTEQCVTVSPGHVLLTSTSPYNPTTQDVDLSATNFTIPAFSATNCGLASGTVTKRFSGSVGNVLTLDLHGALTVPPPATPTTTTLTANPATVLAGQTVTLSAKISGTNATSPTTGPTGTMTFFNGTTALATEQVTTTTVTYETTTLPAGTDRLSAVYSGGNGFKGSTSADLTYIVVPAPSLTFDLPSSVATGDATPTPFTLVIANPADGRTWTNLYLKLRLSGIRGLTGPNAMLQYQDSANAWCTPPGWGGSGIVVGFFLGAGTTCTPTYPASFALAKDSSLTVHLRIAYPNATLQGLPYGGTQTVTGILSTGTCSATPTTPTTVGCSTVAPLTGSAAPVGSGSYTLLMTGGPVASKVRDVAPRPVTSTVAKTFNIGMKAEVGPVSFTGTGGSTGLPAPTGKVTYGVDGKTVLSATLVPGPKYTSETALQVFDTATLSVGKHKVTESYSGNQFYSPSLLSVTVTVAPQPAGTAFSCTLAGIVIAQLPAYISATGTVPTSVIAKTGSLSASNISVTVTIDPVEGFTQYNLPTQTPATLGFSPTGTNAKAGPITFTGVTGRKTGVVGTWTGLSTSVPVSPTATPGTTIAVGENSLYFVGGLFGSLGVTCTPAVSSVSAPIGSSTVAGTNLAASPASPAPAGSPVTLTATVYPTPTGASPASHVTFFEGSQNIGSATVAKTGPAIGTASLTIQTGLAIGAYTFHANWSGTTTVPANTSATISYAAVAAAPVVTTQPANQKVAAGQAAVFKAAASGAPTPTVQWQVSTDGGKTWGTVAGGTATSLSVTAASADSGSEYRAVFTNSGGTATSSAATLTVQSTTGNIVPTPVSGYHLVASNGSVYSYGGAPFYGSMGGQTLNKPIVGTATTPGDGGYWLVASDGGIFSFGNAAFYGSMGGKPLNQPIVGMASTFDGKGYWEVASDGGIFAFGDAAFYGSMGGKTLNQPIVGIAATPDGKGYWEVASDGGIFAFGDAQFYGSTGSLTLNKPIVGVASTNNGAGYWLVAADGGVFAFGNAGFHGTVAGTTSASIVSLVPTGDNGGYWETASNGQVFQFGDATSAGTALTQTATIVAMSD
jgi:Bacterial Ig-like domain (group 3)/Immunoglobulin I-set domain